MSCKSRQVPRKLLHFLENWIFCILDLDSVPMDRLRSFHLEQNEAKVHIYTYIIYITNFFISNTLLPGKHNFIGV